MQSGKILFFCLEEIKIQGLVVEVYLYRSPVIPDESLRYCIFTVYILSGWSQEEISPTYKEIST